VTYSFSANTTILSAEANTNFADIVSFLNGEVIHKDAAIAFTNVPSGPASNPSSDNQFTRKKYVDDECDSHVNDRAKIVKRVVSGSGHDSITTSAFYITNMNFTYTFVSGRVYEIRVTAHCDWSSGQGVFLGLYENTTLIARLFQDNEAAGAGRTITGFWTTAATSGAKTYRLGIASISGSGLNLNGDLKPTELLVIDHGPAPA
jgi:hypothetical protein